MSEWLPYEIYYQNAKGDVIRFDTPPLILNTSTLWDVAWEVTMYNRAQQDGGKITRARRPAVQKQIILNCAADTQQEHNAALNSLANIIEYDNANNLSGRLYLNGYYVTCRLTESYKTLDREFPNSSLVNLTVQVERPAWCKETQYSYTPGSVDINSGAKSSYLAQYPYSYAPSTANVTVVNSAVAAAPMRVVFYGPAANPKIYFGDIAIGLDVTLSAGEYAVINQLTREVYKVSRDGVKTNCFNNRYKAQSIFTALPSGTHQLSASTGLTADVYVIEQRSEPLWN